MPFLLLKNPLGRARPTQHRARVKLDFFQKIQFLDMIRRIYSDPPETISVTLLTETGHFGHVQCCVGLALTNAFLSGRNRLPAKQGWRKILEFLKFVENSSRWVDYSVEFTLRIENQSICLISLYISFTSVKGNQANLLIFNLSWGILDPFHTKIDPSRGIFNEFQNFQNCSSLFLGG